MLARWYLLLGQFSVTFEYRPGAQHANADGMSRQCGQRRRPDCPVSSSNSQVAELDVSSVLLDQPFASSEMGDSMNADLLPELSGETWGGLFNAIADLYICDGFARLLRRRKVKLTIWLSELLKAIARTSLIEYRKQLTDPLWNIVDVPRARYQIQILGDIQILLDNVGT